MRKIGLILAAAVLSPVATQAATYYNFNNLTAGSVPAANSSDTTGVQFLGGSAVGSVGQDNWVLTSGTGTAGAIVRNDARPGFSGNYVSGYPTANTTPNDTIETRVNTGAATFGFASNSPITVSFVASIGTFTSGASTLRSRAEMALGYDQNKDGDIRGNAATAENNEVSAIFGYDSGGGGEWYLRGAAFTNAAASNAVAVAPISGTYLISMTLDPTASGGNGSAVLSAAQLYDASGTAVNGPLTQVLTLDNLNLLAMNTATNPDGATLGANPANWNGLLIRVSNNGAIDDISVPEPTSLALFGLAGVGALTRRRRA